MQESIAHIYNGVRRLGTRFLHLLPYLVLARTGFLEYVNIGAALDRTGAAHDTAISPPISSTVTCRLPDELIAHVIAFVDDRNRHDLLILLTRVSRQFRAIAIEEGVYNKLYISGERRRFHKSKLLPEPEPSLISKVLNQLPFPFLQSRPPGLTFAAIAREMAHPWPEMEAEWSYTEEELMDVDKAVLQLFLGLLQDSAILRMSVREIVFRSPRERPKRFNISPNLLRELLTLDLPLLDTVDIQDICIMDEIPDYDGYSSKPVLRTLRISDIFGSEFGGDDSTCLAHLLHPFDEIGEVSVASEWIARRSHKPIPRERPLKVLQVALPDCSKTIGMLEFMQSTLDAPALQELSLTKSDNDTQDLQRLVAGYTNISNLKIAFGGYMRLYGPDRNVNRYDSFPSTDGIYEGLDISGFKNLVALTIKGRYCIGNPRKELQAVFEMINQVADTRIQHIQVDLDVYGDIWEICDRRWRSHWKDSLAMAAALDWEHLEDSLNSQFECLKRLRISVTHNREKDYSFAYDPQEIQQMIEEKLTLSRARELLEVSTIVWTAPYYLRRYGQRGIIDG